MQKRPITSLITSRYDIKALATIAKFYESQGIHIHNKSTLPTKIIYDFEKLLIINNLVEPFASTSEARDYLKSLNMPVVPKELQGAYLKQLEVESIILEGPIPPSQDNTDSDLRATVAKIASKTKEDDNHAN